MKKTIIIAVAVIACLLAGCQVVPVSRDRADIPETKTGTQAVVLSSLPNAPPPEIFEDSVFKIIAEISNRGASDISNGYTVLGFEEQYFALLGKQPVNRFSVKGKSIFNPEGAKTRVDFSVKSAELLPEQQSYPSQFVLSACYPYETDAVLQACVDTDIYDAHPGKVCRPAPASFSGGQGAPVSVTRIEPYMLPHTNPDLVRPQFVITIRNLGNGQVVAKERVIDACSGRPLGDSWGVVNAEVHLSEIMLECNQGREIRLRNNEAKIVCTTAGRNGIHTRMGTYTAPLKVKLSYGYVNNLVMPVEIVKP